MSMSSEIRKLIDLVEDTISKVMNESVGKEQIEQILKIYFRPVEYSVDENGAW
jgi:hypothetical protein